jgi:hypothetical protein
VQRAAMCVRRTWVLAGRTDLRMTTRKLGCPTEYPRVPPGARGGPAAAAARSLRSPATLASRDRIGDEAQARDRAVLAARTMASKRPLA